jgi:hypothetical protein
MGSIHRDPRHLNNCAGPWSTNLDRGPAGERLAGHLLDGGVDLGADLILLRVQRALLQGQVQARTGATTIRQSRNARLAPLRCTFLFDC